MSYQNSKSSCNLTRHAAFGQFCTTSIIKSFSIPKLSRPIFLQHLNVIHGVHSCALTLPHLQNVHKNNMVNKEYFQQFYAVPSLVLQIQLQQHVQFFRHITTNRRINIGRKSFRNYIFHRFSQSDWLFRIYNNRLGLCLSYRKSTSRMAEYQKNCTKNLINNLKLEITKTIKTSSSVP
ncbi:hypothetical protein AGLY_010582 [Aphis glycines]|uniref:Uncharacterized protein n=1 Tax=Aphis glycines TaxID=307491 RepID=A0A6G0TDZ5_APHGL|nr:hypothetical protein AGLY_010582 [Aphis glycines]